MPTRPARLTRRSFEALVQDLFYCPACSTWRTAHPNVSAQHVSSVRRRWNSTLVSSTAVNATKNIPPQLRGLHDALQNLQKKAPSQINQSRLQLALSGLATDKPATRIAILDVNNTRTSRQIVRLLLADVLGKEEAWEKLLVPEDQQETGGILIRYGEATSPSIQPSRTAIPTISVPSPLLREHNLEILVSSISSNGLAYPSSRISSDVFLTPFAETPTSVSGRQTIVSFPVHKTLVLANGVDEFQSLSQILALTSYNSTSERELVDSMVNLPGTAGKLQSERIRMLDISSVEDDLKEARRSIEHTPRFGVSWTGSGLPHLKQWLSESSVTSNGHIATTLLQVVQSILDAASANIEQQAFRSMAERQTDTISEETRTELQGAIDMFLAQAHLELQTGLARAFESSSWRKLAWYKLFYRVDDVPLIITDIVERYWLRESSLTVFEMLGRLHQAGLIRFVSYDGKIIEFATSNGNELSLPSPPNAASDTTDYLEIPDQPKLKTSELSRSRQALLATTIPTMTATAQSSLFKAVGFSATTTALSALTYMSTIAPSLYECGAIFALGVVFSLRRLQKQWEACRSGFKRDIFAAGRTALKSTEDLMRLAVREGGRKPVDEIEVELCSQANAAVEQARKALDSVRK
ncbi:hypothetical protein UCRPC4_g02547 [Phaeomoniella chlamydospora]|uniref:Mmc1 C-terminal domain-containing protein n=1 Tax=Phaeomoniella chlamydospora TaxID=158046 RepID=A0A0G2EPW9_PHACM|nr:hypothetical protein UCRPC4_g02547 [Phaeomoniella chlamydospora]